jgi:Cdc6-like AAA superfamily ATPase
MVVLLSNNPRFLGELDSSTRSTLQPEVLLFKNYDAVQIAEILKERAKKGLANFSLADLRKIAGLAVREASSDVRVALKTLFYSVTEKQKDVRVCFGRALRDIYKDLVVDLNDQNLLILRAVVSSRDKFVKDVHRIYCRLAEGLGERCFSYVHFLNSLSYLQGLGLVVLLSTKVNRCYTNRVNLLFSEKVLEKVYTMRFG